MGCENNTDGYWVFEIVGDNTGVINVVDPLLDSVALAKERAESEFLKSSYSINDINFSTHRSDMVLNQLINLEGINYLVKDISYTIDDVSIVANIRARRYN